MKPVKINSWGVFYKVRHWKEIDDSFISKTDWPKELCLGVSFNPISVKKFFEQKKVFPAKYKVLLCCYSKVKGIDPIHPAADALGIEMRAPKNLAELKKVQSVMIRKLLKRFKYKRTAEYRKNVSEYVKKYLSKTKSVFIVRNGRIDGLFSMLPAVGGNAAAVKYDAIAWHQFPEKMTPGEKASVHYQISLWLSGLAKLKVAVKIDPRDKDIVCFLSKLGFTASNLQFFRKK